MTKHILSPHCTILEGDCRESLRSLPDESVHCCVTSPPYWGLRDYGVDGQIGLEQTPDEYVAEMVAVFKEVRRVLRSDGTLWLNLGDSYNSQGTMGPTSDASITGQGMGFIKTKFPGLKPKDLVGIPWRVAFALQADGWYLRQDIIWHKPNPMPESVTDRCTKAHEYLFLMAKSERYWYDQEAIKEPAEYGENRATFRGGGVYTMNRSFQNSDKVQGDGEIDTRKETQSRNRRSVWTVATQPFSGAHFATFPPALITPCILAGCPEGGMVLDPFNGAGTTGLVALRYGREYVGCELNPEYVEITRKRLDEEIGQGDLFKWRTP